MNRCATCLCVLSVLLATTAAIADDAQSIFDSLFRERIRQAKASSNDSDDLALATEMLAALDSVDDKRLVSLICENVFTLAPRSADGLKLAANSMQQLAAKLPDQRLSALERTADLYKSAYFRTRGDARTKLGPVYAEAVASLGDAQFDAGDWQAAIVSYRRARVEAQYFTTDGVGVPH